MFNRRTLATITAVAALAGGAAGGVTSTITTPDSAGAANVPVSPTNPKQLRQPTDSQRIKWIDQTVDKLTVTLNRVDARTAAIEARTDENKQMIDSLTSMTARSSSGRSLVNLVDDILSKSRLICAETVGEVFLGADRHVAACD